MKYKSMNIIIIFYNIDFQQNTNLPLPSMVQAEVKRRGRDILYLQRWVAYGGGCGN